MMFWVLATFACLVALWGYRATEPGMFAVILFLLVFWAAILFGAYEAFGSSRPHSGLPPALEREAWENIGLSANSLGEPKYEVSCVLGRNPHWAWCRGWIQDPDYGYTYKSHVHRVRGWGWETWTAEVRKWSA